MKMKKVFPNPQFVEAFVDTILPDLSAANYILGENGARVVSTIKTKITKTTKTTYKGMATITCAINELDTMYVMYIPAKQVERGNYAYNPYKAVKS